MDNPWGFDLFQEYKDELRNKNRFFPNKKFCRLFDAILDSEDNIYALKAKSTLYRARNNGGREHFEKISDLGMNKTNPSVNRASPKGIPYMYLAEDIKTAITEIRPNVKNKVTVATFEMKNDLKVLTLESVATHGGTINNSAEFQSTEIAGFILYLSYSFSTPVQQSAELDYLPCQYFAEYCKQKGFDGIRYISAACGKFGTNDPYFFNYVLFDDSNVCYVEAHEYHIDEINYGVSHKGEVELK